MKYSIFVFLISLTLLVFSQETKNVKKSPIEYFEISGNYRFYGQHRLMDINYPLFNDIQQEVFTPTRSILIGDASQLPELTLNLMGKTSKGSSFGTDLVLWNQNTGSFDYYRGLQLGINLYGNFVVGKQAVAVRAGGIHWHEMTPFTLRSFSGYNRYSVWDRNPWDPQFNAVAKRYEEYFANGSISQDNRWAKQAIQGIIVDAINSELGFKVNFIYGKSQFTGARFLPAAPAEQQNYAGDFLQFYDNTIPNQLIGGSILKTIGKHEFKLNSLNSLSYSDENTNQLITNYVQTASFNLQGKHLSLQGEAGGSSYSSTSQKLGLGEMIFLKLKLHKSLIKIPIELHGFYIAPEAINNNSEIVNTSVVETNSAASSGRTAIASNGVLQQNGSAMLAIGQLANNRTGITLNADGSVRNLKVSLGLSAAKEITPLNNELTYGHVINGLTTSRFWRWSFPSGVGPYGRTTVIYRNIFETVKLRPSVVEKNKYFNNIELQAKYKFKAFKKPYYLFYLGTFNSAQNNFSPVTVFSEQAYIRYYSHQMEGFLSLNSKLIFNQYIGWERVLGNYDTDLDDQTGRPRNQEGISLGLGLDYLLAKSTVLYLRHKYFSFEDINFKLDKYRGHETTVELKIYF